MPLELVPGQNCPMPDQILSVMIETGAPADFSCFRLYADNKTRIDADFVFYGQKRNDDATIELGGSDQAALFSVNLPSMTQACEKIVFAVTSDFPNIASLKRLNMHIAAGSEELAECQLDLAGREEAALILGEFYRRSGQWKFRFIAQGFKGGLKPLAEMYGVEIADEPVTRPTPPPVNLSKIVLTKAEPKVDLAKNRIGQGMIRVNLNWNQGEVKRGIFGRISSRSIDLDLAAYVRLKDGSQTVIQALGENFGEIDYPPYVQLQGDDRTGAQSEGEWIYISGEHIDKIDEIVIFTFIYEGVPNWRATDAVVRIDIPGLPEVETRMNEGNSKLGLCAIARIINKGSSLKIERLEDYFAGHEPMDRAYGWGFRWKAGRK